MKVYKLYYWREQIGKEYYLSKEEAITDAIRLIQEWQFDCGIFNTIDYIRQKLDYYINIYSLEIDEFDM